MTSRRKPPPPGPRVSALMTPFVESIRPRAGAREAAVRMRAFGLGFLPVVRNGDLVGVLTDRDLVLRGIAEGLPLSRTPVESLMSERWVGVQPEEPVESAIKILEAARIRRLPVVDALGRLQGVIGMADLLRAGFENRVMELYSAVSAPDRVESIVLFPGA